MTNEQLIESLKKLKLNYLKEHLTDFIQKGTKKNLSPMQLIENLIQFEIEDKSKRSTTSRLKSAKLGRFKPYADFDWNWPKVIPRSQIEQLFR